MYDRNQPAQTLCPLLGMVFVLEGTSIALAKPGQRQPAIRARPADTGVFKFT